MLDGRDSVLGVEGLALLAPNEGHISMTKELEFGFVRPQDLRPEVFCLV